MHLRQSPFQSLLPMSSRGPAQRILVAIGLGVVGFIAGVVWGGLLSGLVVGCVAGLVGLLVGNVKLF